MVGEIDIHGEIGTRVTLDTVISDISKTPGATSWNVYLASEGGDVYEGLKIYHKINSLPNVTVIVEGLAASIATLIMQAGKKIIGLNPSDFMIHNPWGSVEGESKDFTDAAAQLNRVKSTIISVLKKRMPGKSDQEIAAMMDNETWMSAEEAKAHGLIDEVQDRLRAVAKFDFKKFTEMENTITKEEAKGMFESLGNKILKALNLTRIQNAMPMTLADGTKVIIDTDNDQDINGKAITDEAGAPLADGPYKLADGREITVAAGMITETEVQAKTEDPMKQENEALKKQVAELTAQLTAKAAAETTANKTLMEIQNSVKTLKAEYDTLKNATFGDNSAPGSNVAAELERTKTKESIKRDPMLAAFAEHASGVFGDNLKRNN